MKKRLKIKEELVNITFYGPALILYVTVIVSTAIISIYYSMTDWDGLKPFINFIGVHNFIDLFKDDLFYNALKNTLIFAITYTILHNIFGLLLALVFRKETKINMVVKSLIFIPVILSPVIVSFLWDYIYAPMTGILSRITQFVGVRQEIGWLGNPKLTMPLIIITQLWYMVGFSMVIYIAGLKAIPKQYYEAAQIDGTNKWQQFRHITVPLLAPVTTILIIYDMITSLKVFEIIYIMTNGGPGYATETITIMVFREAFRNSRMGYATAVSLVLFLIVLIITIFQLKFLGRREVEY